jgi:hypothetical protein
MPAASNAWLPSPLRGHFSAAKNVERFSISVKPISGRFALLFRNGHPASL